MSRLGMLLARAALAIGESVTVQTVGLRGINLPFQAKPVGSAESGQRPEVTRDDRK